MNDAVIQTENLTKIFGWRRNEQKQIVAVNKINLYVEPHQVYGFLGPNGAGKSTTLRMLLNLLTPTSGDIRIFGEDPRQNPHVLRRVGHLVEGATFYPYLSALDNLQVVGLSQGNFDRKQAIEKLHQFGLGGREKQKVGTFSTGMKQRLGLAAAMLNDPELLILDEPTNGMDPLGIRDMRAYMRQMAHQMNKTVLLTSHQLDEVERTCDRIAVIHKGDIIKEGPVDELLERDSMFSFEVSSAGAAALALQDWKVRPNADTNTILVEAVREDVPGIVKTLTQHQIDIYDVRPYQKSMEALFFEISGEQMEHEHG
ncbi:MAG: ABC transporter ATP-binding protein [Chloroflexi bacterium]|nr:ABC transporter ATP-binding protein [Chloroflexota bacterium]